MTLTAVEFRSVQGLVLTLPLGDISQGFLIQSIDGLDPVPAVVTTSSYASLDGEPVQSVRRGKRNIVARFGLETDQVDETVAQLRAHLYKFLMPKQTVRMRFTSDDIPMVEIYGVVETHTSPKFVKDPYSNVSIVCEWPDFYEPTQISASGSTVPSSSTTWASLEYEGSIETGILLRMQVPRAVDNFTIQHRTGDGSVRSMQIAGSFLANDIIEISTVPGNKYATRRRGNVVTSVLYAVSPYAVWTEFLPGKNDIRVVTEGAPIPFTLLYTNKHGGL